MKNIKKTSIPKISLLISILIIILILILSGKKVQLLGMPAIHVLIALQFITGGIGMLYTKKINVLTGCWVIIVGLFNLIYLLIFY